MALATRMGAMDQVDGALETSWAAPVTSRLGFVRRCKIEPMWQIIVKVIVLEKGEVSHYCI